MNEFYDRISQISKSQGFKSVNKFALEGLKYKSSEKFNRLKKENTYPSVEVLLDISKTFVSINLDWLVTGRGNMELRSVNSRDENFNLETYNAELIQNQRDLIEAYKKIRDLERELSEFKTGNANAS